MCKGISGVRGYVGVTSGIGGASRRGSSEKAGKSEKHPQQAGMSKEMNRLAGYVGRGRRDNRDF
jgi:hypothetical protein